jgi:HSP20 family protein
MTRLELIPRSGRGGRYGEMVPLRALMDRLLESAFAPPMLSGGDGSPDGFGVDVEEDDDAYYVSCPLPGVNPDDVELSVHENTISISGELRRRGPEGRRPVMRESHLAWIIHG